MKTFSNIPTNIISGFLGAGKTTAIQFLLKQKPASETWAVIVNEFGQIGIDGALLKNKEVEIKEIPGGCLCCVGSQSLSVGLNQIIRNIKPDRIIIEPTGLGHPAKLIESLTGEFYQSVLDLKAVINLLDARHLDDERYINNETFIDQSKLADILIASKLDTYTEEDRLRFLDYAMAFNPAKSKVAMIEQGKLQLDWLDMPRLQNKLAKFPHLHSGSHAHSGHNSEQLCEITDIQHQGWLMVEGHASGYFSVGWKLEKSYVFNREKLTVIIDNLFNAGDIERAKGVLHTASGWISINFTQNEQQLLDCGAGTHSILEIISSELVDSSVLDKSLRDCLSL